MSRAVAVGVVAALLSACAGLAKESRNLNDWVLAAYARQQALEVNGIGQQQEWRNPSTGHSGSIVPLATYRRPDGAYCRQYREMIADGVGQRTFVETACRDADGTWHGVTMQ